jgi:hypothetical protein
MFFHHDRLGLAQLLGGTEHHELGAGLVHRRDVAGRGVEGVAGLKDLLAIGVAKDQPAADDVAPMRALAAVVWKPFHERCPVDVLAERREIHRVAIELVGPIHNRAKLPALRRAVP